MIYSVFDWNTGQYLYFEGPGEGLGVRPQAKRVLNDVDGKGHKLEDLLPEVPPGSQRWGSGTEPHGRIAVLNSGLRLSLGADPTQPLLLSSPWVTLGLWAAGVIVAYKVAVALGQSVARGGR